MNLAQARKTLAALALTALVAGCARLPAGTDGKLGNEWPALAEPTGWRPVAGVCLSWHSDFLRRVNYKPEDCAQAHYYEIVHIAEMGQAPVPPAKSTEAYRKAWAECDAKTSELLGGPWRERRVNLALSLPTAEAWAAGARWVVCAAAQVRRLNDGDTMLVRGSFKGRFADPELQFGCVQVEPNGNFVPRSCAEPHNAEFAGVADWPGSWESALAESDKDLGHDHALCARVVATFAGAASVRTGTWIWLPKETDWHLGDRALRCYLYLDTTQVSASLKGVGSSGWPIR